MRNTVAKRLRKEARSLTTNFAFDLLEKVTFKRGAYGKVPRITLLHGEGSFRRTYQKLKAARKVA
jgi:hypothetical protein